MITITQKEEDVFNRIKTLDSDLNEEISLKSLKDELCTGNFHEYDLIQVLNSLSAKHLIDFDGGHVRSVNKDIEFNTVTSKSDLKELELSMMEKNSFKLTVVDEDNMVSKYILEGNLLYGDLKLTNFRMFHILLSLENKGLLKKVHKSDGEYYKVVE